MPVGARVCSNRERKGKREEESPALRKTVKYDRIDFDPQIFCGRQNNRKTDKEGRAERENTLDSDSTPLRMAAMSSEYFPTAFAWHLQSASHRKHQGDLAAVILKPQFFDSVKHKEEGAEWKNLLIGVELLGLRHDILVRVVEERLEGRLNCLGIHLIRCLVQLHRVCHPLNLMNLYRT